MPPDVQLRSLLLSDLPVFFEQQQDPQANFMAAFTSQDPANRALFEARWEAIRRDSTIYMRTILSGGQVAGNILSYLEGSRREIGYWLGRSFWGQGIATQALSAFLQITPERPLFARVASDNLASRRVLEKCGFLPTGVERGFANARGAEIYETVYRLDGSAQTGETGAPQPLNTATGSL